MGGRCKRLGPLSQERQVGAVGRCLTLGPGGGARQGQHADGRILGRKPIKVQRTISNLRCEENRLNYDRGMITEHLFHLKKIQVTYQKKKKRVIKKKKKKKKKKKS